MNCPHCQGEAKKCGKNRNGSQRYVCDACKKKFTDETTRPADRREVPRDKAIMVLRMLLEGSSVRSTERLTGVHRDTILALLVDAGMACDRLLDRLVVNLPVEDVQADEIWSFVKCKEKTRLLKNYPEWVGDSWCFVAMERTSKIILAWHMDRRTPEATRCFANKLRKATAGRFQLSTDGFRPYRTAIWDTFGPDIDFGQLVKVYGNPPEGGAQARYSPGEVIGAEPTVIIGNPDDDKICTSHSERQNLSMRMTLRRLTRLTNAHSKKSTNHYAALALYFAFFNFCRDHETLHRNAKAKCTPAMAAGLTDHVWSVGELLANAV
ncbi:MAG TPA: IS1 family transposase [Gemmataceae bacterium]|jgi:transposase-like protein/IS1 family transposase|nr:IS1 family transposase [Gemmataceae bacterium]